MAHLVEYLIILNIGTLLMYAIDKIIACAHWNRNRISEKTLLGLSTIAPLGGILGMIVFRHKTKKMKFWIHNLSFLALHVWLFWQMIAKKYELITNPETRADFNMNGFQTPSMEENTPEFNNAWKTETIESDQHPEL